VSQGGEQADREVRGFFFCFSKPLASATFHVLGRFKNANVNKIGMADAAKSTKGIKDIKAAEQPAQQAAEKPVQAPAAAGGPTGAQPPSEEKHEPSFRLAQIRAFVIMLLQMSQLWNAVLISLGFISFALFFPFYGLLLPVFAIVVFVIGYHNPIFGTIVSFLLILPAVAFQTPVLAWLFLVVIGAVFFAVFSSWYVIAALLFIVSAPFAPEPFNMFLGPLVIPVLALSALRLGSKKASYVIPIAIYLVLLLSVLWQAHNASFLTVSDKSLASMRTLIPSKEAPELAGIVPGIGEAVANLFSFDVIQDVNVGIGLVARGTMDLFFSDAGFVQILMWSLALYGVAYLPLVLYGKWSQFLPSLALLLLIPAHFISSEISGTMFDIAVVPAVLLTIALMWLMDKFNIKITREEEIVAETRKGAFGIPGLTDLSVSRTGPQSLSEVGNYDSIKKEIRESILMPLEHRELTVLYNVRPPKGILLFGPPGTGKTMLMSALAKELRMNFYYVKTADILGQYLGESEKHIAELFKVARKNAPVVLFFDEIDSIGKKRDMGGGADADQAVSRALSTMLTEMDGMKEKEQIIVVAATNVPNQLDPALLRPGRFDKIIYMPPPDAEGREAIFKVVAKKLPLDKDVDFKRIAKITERFTGADIANAALEAARRAAPAAVEKGKVIPIKMEDFTSVLKSLKPSTTYEMLEDYQKFRTDYERRAVKEEVKAVEEKVITWSDVVGLDDVRKVLTEAIELPLLHEEELKKYNVKPAKGLLLFGPPGTGKTLIVKAASHELNATFISLTPADVSRYGYENAVRLVKETFNRARENAPAVIFIDELESLVPSRELYASKITEEIVSEFLQQMDGMKELKNVMLVGATNKPQMIDPALLRPGRFDKILFVGPPTKEGRIKLFQHNLEGIRGADQIDYAQIVEETEGFTGADIAGICQDVKMQLVRAKIAGKAEPGITTQDILDVTARRSRSVTVSMLKEYLQFVKEYGERR